MPKKEIRLALFLKPSRIYLNSILLIHSLSTLCSLFLALSLFLHLVVVIFIAASLCIQLNILSNHSDIEHIAIQDHLVTIKYRHLNNVDEACGTLMPSAWILPGLCTLSIQLQQRRINLPIFKDSLDSEAYRQLRVYLLRGPLFKPQKMLNNRS